MGFSDLLPELGNWVKDVRGRLTSNADMGKVTWFRVGGPAQLMFQPADEEDLRLFLSHLPRAIPVLMVGIGSNLLVRDGGIPGVVIRLSAKGFGNLSLEEGGKLRVGAAVPDRRFAAFALQSGLDGFAFYHGIPGNIGGALRMNAGANGSETQDNLIEVVAIDRSGRRLILSREQMGYSYRHSKAAEELIFTEAIFQGMVAEPRLIQSKMEEVQHHRETVQPIREKTGGSTFKNPQGSSAWREIDRAGCRGLRIGGAMMSEMHCNFMINEANASALDLERLGETVRARVLISSNIRLQWEIKRLGLWPDGVRLEEFQDSVNPSDQEGSPS